jgi:hypothetical protein
MVIFDIAIYGNLPRLCGPDIGAAQAGQQMKPEKNGLLRTAKLA